MNIIDFTSQTNYENFIRCQCIESIRNLIKCDSIRVISIFAWSLESVWIFSLFINFKCSRILWNINLMTMTVIIDSFSYDFYRYSLPCELNLMWTKKKNVVKFSHIRRMWRTKAYDKLFVFTLHTMRSHIHITQNNFMKWRRSSSAQYRFPIMLRTNRINRKKFSSYSVFFLRNSITRWTCRL